LYDVSLANRLLCSRIAFTSCCCAITNSIKTNDQAVTAFHSNELGLDISYAQALEGENEITGEMFLGLLDLNKNGKVDANETSFAKLNGDFSTPENIIKLKKAMLDPNNSKSRDIFANWATSELTKKHTEGNEFFVESEKNKRQTVDVLRIQIFHFLLLRIVFISLSFLITLLLFKR